jgi:hypothetical protein
MYELATFEHVKGLYACFLVPKSTKWIYGVLLHNISRYKVDNLGTFLMSDGTCKTSTLRLIREGITRLVKGDAQWLDFKKGFPYGKAQIKQEEFRIRNKEGDKGREEGEERMQKLIAESLATYIMTARVVVAKPPKPAVQRPIYPSKPRTKIASPSGHQKP